MTDGPGRAPSPKDESMTETDLALVDDLTDAEYDNWRACRRNDWPDMPEPTWESTLDSWRQMPDEVRADLSARPDDVEPALLRLVQQFGADAIVREAYGL